MTGPVHISANGQMVTPSLIQFTLFQMIRKQVWDLVKRVSIHPEQMMCVENNLFEEIDLTTLQCSADKIPRDLPLTFCGKPLIQNAEISPDRIQFEDEDGNLIGLLNGLAIPEAVIPND